MGPADDGGVARWGDEARGERRGRARGAMPRVVRRRAVADEAHDSELEARIKAYEMAAKLQLSAPEATAITGESAATQKLYQLADEDIGPFGRQCLLARRMAESGVRFIELNSGNWDQHRDLNNALERNCHGIDQPIAALLADLEERDMLKDTLLIWGGEFGRTPHAQNGDGRDHNNRGYTMWMAGGGVKGGIAHGSTDEYGYAAVEGKVHIHDWHATILHLLGLNHKRLTFNYAGRDFRLTDVHGNVVKEILA